MKQHVEIRHGHVFTTAEKRRARKLLSYAVSTGKVIPQPCKCGAVKAQAHHHDYSKPLEVEWMCAKCHSQLHNQILPLTKACTNCGTVFTPKPTRRRRAQVCSDACRSNQIAKKIAAIWARRRATGLTGRLSA